MDGHTLGRLSVNISGICGAMGSGHSGRRDHQHPAHRGRARCPGQRRHRTRASNGRTDDTLRIVERFTRVDKDTINYRFTIEDPSRWTRPVSGEFPFVRTDERMYEYACHEGNYSLANMLSGARAEERAKATSK